MPILIDTLSIYINDYIEDDYNFKSLILEGCYRKVNFNQENKIKEIFNLLEDNFLRNRNVVLTPVNEKIIYNLINMNIEINVDSESSLQIIVPETLKQQILCCESYYTFEEADDDPEHNTEYNFVLSSISDWSEYLSFLFQDWVFCEDVVNAATIYFFNNNKCNMLGLDYNDLLESQELMSDDLYYKFRECIKMNENNKNSSVEIYGNNNNVQVGDNGKNIPTNYKQEGEYKKGWFEKYGIATIIGAIITGAVSIIIKIFLV